MTDRIAATADGRRVIGGGFTMADTHGFPFDCFVEQCRENGCVPSYPHYFAEAIEHGWDDKRAFERMREAHRVDPDQSMPFEKIEEGCIALFMQALRALPTGAAAVDAARRMRLDLEARGVVVTK